MGIEFSVYATVYNNAYIVEDSIRSLFKAVPFIDELVIVDNYSWDGTWEKLLGLRREYPLKLYRYKCSRGLGRQIAFLRTSGKYVMFVDLDTIYMPEFGYAVKKLLEHTHDGVLWNMNALTTRKTMIKIGGWKDMNICEDWELLYRALRKGINHINPSLYVLWINVRRVGEKRYVKNYIGYIRRRIKNILDTVKGCRFSPRQMVIRNRNKISLSLLFSTLLSMYNINRECSIIDYVYTHTDYILPEEVGLPKDWFFLWFQNVMAHYYAFKNAIKKIFRKENDFKIFIFDTNVFLYRNRSILDKSLERLRSVIRPSGSRLYLAPR